MRDPERLLGGRDVRTTLDGPGSDRVVVACPPHPQFGGDRHDSRLKAVSDGLGDREIDCLRIDYGEWDEGRGERTDVLTALDWADAEYDSVGLFGYSFGGAVALSAAIEADATAAVSVLAPASDAVTGFVPADLGEITVPAQVVYGERDDTAEWQPVVERARDLGWQVESMPADHFFVSQQGNAAKLVASFLDDGLAFSS